MAVGTALASPRTAAMAGRIASAMAMRHCRKGGRATEEVIVGLGVNLRNLHLPRAGAGCPRVIPNY